ncbi:MAG TPA: alpha/beta hydrolase [Mycobacteriales bacterium]|nr:alpha/beta hydrolase [Mycobacteriales bacterium]
MTAVQEDLRTVVVGGVHATVVGAGLPVTLLAHGIGGSVAETRPLATRLGGTRVLMEFRGHGRSDALPGGWDYDVLADDVRAVADATAATQAVGLSLGSGALLRLLADDPDRFARLAFVLPAAIDSTRADGATLRLQRLGAAIDRGDVDAVVGLLLDEVPDAVRARRGTALLLRRRALSLLDRPSPQPLHDDRPLHDRAVLSRVTAPALVVAQFDDPLHRIDVARELTAALPCARLLTLPAGGVFWTAARSVQTALAEHLTEEDA